MIHERFSNRSGKPGSNVSRDRRMEFRIGAEKRLISNLGPSFGPTAIQQVHATVDIKEELYIKTRESHGVRIRRGNHNARSDSEDYALLFKHLTETEAHRKIEGRSFGNFKLEENLMDDNRFDKVPFYRWLAGKNREMTDVLKAKTKYN